jgi:hypothetical protein
MTNNIQYNKWLDYKQQLGNKFLCADKIKLGFNEFKISILDKLPLNEVVLIQLRILQSNSCYKSISPVGVYIASHSDKILNFMIEWWINKGDSYYDINISEVLYTYKIPDPSLNLKKTFIKSKVYNNEELPHNYNESFTFSGYSLPNTMDLTMWGECSFNKDYKKVIIKKPKSHNRYEVNIFDDYYNVNYINISGEVQFTFTDRLILRNDLNSFVRKINNHTYTFENNILITKELKRKVDFIKKGDESYYITKKFLTLDIETMMFKKSDTENKLIPYCISYYDGLKFKSFYLSDYKDSDTMIIECLKSLMIRKYLGYKVYIHNFSKFDGIFLLKNIISLFPNVEPIIKDDQLINIKCNFGPLNKNLKPKYNISFRDSLLTLPSSLKNLAVNFNVENKGLFPYKFVTNDISLNYIGKIPDYKFFIDEFKKEGNITIDEYKHYCNSFKNDNNTKIVWDLKKETIKYCELDCKVLYNIILKFNKQIFELFNLNITDSPTLSSLALKIFKTKFLSESKIPILTGEIYKNIKQAYTGGAVDVYKPEHNIITKKGKGYYYDVNSLYPFVMLNNPMPIGEPTYFEGDILRSFNLQYKVDKPFGIFKVEVETPKSLNIPILQLRFKNKSGFKTISPIGKWTGWYFSEEIYNAIKFGYKFKIIKGYLFDKGYIFTDYVNTLYDLKLNSEKNSANYTISKLLLNSLYGKLGMNPELQKHAIVKSNNDDYYKLFIENTVTKFVDFNNGTEIVSLSKKNNNTSEIDLNNSKMSKTKFDVSIAIAVAVTGYARIYMSAIKNMNDTTLYYSDTDSVILDKPLNNNMIGPELGQLKLEYTFDEGIFLCPKVYGIKYSDKEGIKKELVKIKGLKNPISFDEMKSLLIKNSKLPINQEKWYRSISDGGITIKDEIYTLMLTENKRKLIYNNNNIFENTLPFIINNEDMIENNHNNNN